MTKKLAHDPRNRYVQGIGEGPLDLATAKLEWGRFRLRELDSDVKRAVREADRNPFSMYSDTVTNTTRIAWDPGGTEGAFSLRVGEIVHALRSALDVLVWGFSKDPLNIKGPKPSFPIFGCEADYVNYGHRSVRGLSTSGQEIVVEQQPFRWPQGLPETDPLFELSELNNLDKHRSPHAILIGATYQDGPLDKLVEDLGPRLIRTPAKGDHGELLLLGETIVELFFVADDPMDVDFPEYLVTKVIDVAFDDRMPVMATLNEIGIRVEGIIRTFANALDSGRITMPDPI